MKTKNLLLKIPLYYFFRNFNFPTLMPFNYSLSLTYKCNSKCKTCKIWQIQKNFLTEELTTEEWIKTIKSFGNSPFWITLTGGEPFLREDLEKIIEAINYYNKPQIINIPTNAIIDSSNRIKNILEILDERTLLIINFSLDGIGKDHDFIRGVKGNWKRFLIMYKNTKKLKKEFRNLAIGINTVISKWNVKKIQEICEFVVKKLKPDNFITEIAQNRVELNTLNLDIAPETEEYCKSIKLILKTTLNKNKIINAFRKEYYRYVCSVLKNKKGFIKSYAGFASVHITPFGKVWDCSVFGNEIGDLKEFDFNFKKLWKNKKAKIIRKKIKKTHKCILANEFYSNSIFDLKTIIKVFLNLF